MRTKSLVFADQASSSAGNFLLVAGAAHAMELPVFGRFALTYAAMQFGIEMSRALVAEPAQLLEDDSRGAGFSALRVGRQSATVAIGVALVVALAVVLFESSIEDGAWLLVSLPAIAWFEGLRHRALVTGHEARAAVANLVWLGLVVVVIAVPAVSDVAFRTAGSAIASWAFAALLASTAFVGLSTGSEGAPLGVVCARGRRFATETLADRGLIFAGLGIGGAIIGAAGFGEVSAGRAVFAATNVAVSASLLILTTQFITTRRYPPGVEVGLGSTSAPLRVAVALAPLALFVVDELSGNLLARLVLGDREPPRIFLASAAVFFAGVAASVGPRAWLRGRRQDARAVRLRSYNGLLVAGSGVAGALLFDAEGMAVGLAVGAIAGAALWHWGASRIAR